MISIIIPTLNESAHLPNTLQSLSRLKGHFEIIIVDGGSTDGTASVLPDQKGIQLITMRNAQRAGQMNAGAEAASGDILWFLHADMEVPENSLACIEASCNAATTVGGSFRMRFDCPEWPYSLLGFFTRINSRFWTFGDQGIFVKKNVFAAIGGYTSLPILEDLELQLRLRQIGRFVKAPATVTTSSRRYRQRGVWREFLRDVRVVIGFFLGVRVGFLKTWYTKFQS